MKTIWTVGHSSRSISDFLALLAAEHIERIADVRRYPGSRAHPQFNPGPLAAAVNEEGIDYLPLPELGGRRPPSPTSKNTVWRNSAFRGYADYMETPEIRAGLQRLVHAATESRTAILCSEAVWWRCHRAMIADALKVDHFTVLHIMGIGKTVEHPFTSPARVVEGRLQYGEADSDT